MHFRFGYLVAAGAVAAILGAPVAAADDTGQSCTDTTGSGTECSSPGNVQINDSPPVTAEPFLGGFYGGPYPVPWDEGGR
jgi:hypothetical protein